MSDEKKKQPIMERRAYLTPKAEEIIEKHLKWAFEPKKDQKSEESKTMNDFPYVPGDELPEEIELPDGKILKKVYPCGWNLSTGLEIRAVYRLTCSREVKK